MFQKIISQTHEDKMSLTELPSGELLLESVCNGRISRSFMDVAGASAIASLLCDFVGKKMLEKDGASKSEEPCQTH
jgi:hypothetical protein